jgi:hypothetical protein
LASQTRNAIGNSHATIRRFELATEFARPTDGRWQEDLEMDSFEVIKTHLVLIRELLDTTIDGADDETMMRVLPGSTVGSPASIYAHAVSSEDWAVQNILLQKPQIFETNGWQQKLNVPVKPDGQDWNAWPWNGALFAQYVAEVRANTDAYLASLSEADLDRKIDWFGRRMETVAWVLSDTIFMHQPEHAGEIAALRGVMGQQGLPY